METQPIIETVTDNWTVTIADNQPVTVTDNKPATDTDHQPVIFTDNNTSSSSKMVQPPHKSHAKITNNITKNHQDMHPNHVPRYASTMCQKNHDMP
jgi:hypothetical protein